MALGAAMHESLKAGRPVLIEEKRTIADALQGGVGLDNRHTFDLCSRFLDDFVLLSEAEIASAVRSAFYNERLVLEGAGACGLAALLQRGEEYAGAKAAVICTGDNIDPEDFRKLIQ
jgi:threonine dehydratase